MFTACSHIQPLTSTNFPIPHAIPRPPSIYMTTHEFIPYPLSSDSPTRQGIHPPNLHPPCRTDLLHYRPSISGTTVIPTKTSHHTTRRMELYCHTLLTHLSVIQTHPCTVTLDKRSASLSVLSASPCLQHVCDEGGVGGQ